MEEKSKESVLIIPDVHGREFWRDGLNKRKEGELIIFLGDYVDPYPDEGIGHEVVPGVIEEILNIPNTILLLGNHDLSYIYPERSPHVRYDMNLGRRKKIYDLFCNNRDRFLMSFILERPDYPGNIVFSHAGYLKDKYHRFGKEKRSLQFCVENSNNFWKSGVIEPGLFDISYFRGGYDNYGSFIWADIREHIESNNHFWTHDYQVFAHTRLYEGKIITNYSKFAMLDCRRPVRMWYNKKKPEFEIL